MCFHHKTVLLTKAPLLLSRCLHFKDALSALRCHEVLKLTKHRPQAQPKPKALPAAEVRPWAMVEFMPVRATSPCTPPMIVFRASCLQRT